MVLLSLCVLLKNINEHVCGRQKLIFGVNRLMVYEQIHCSLFICIYTYCNFMFLSFPLQWKRTSCLLRTFHSRAQRMLSSKSLARYCIDNLRISSFTYMLQFLHICCSVSAFKTLKCLFTAWTSEGG